MPESLTKSQISALFKKYSFRPHKKLGQNFLIDKNIISKILECISPEKEDIFVEIGAGLGALTFPLAKRVNKVIAFEIDEQLTCMLRELTEAFKNIVIKRKDFLKYNLAKDFKGKRIRLVGNIPYYITSLIIEKLVEIKNRASDIHIMTQKEFAERLLASAKTDKNYSSITLFSNYHFVIEKLFVVKKTCFWPKPEVDSIVLRFKPRNTLALGVGDEKLLFDIIRSAFGKRRKTILNSLSSSNIRPFRKSNLEVALKKANIATNLRAEELTLEDFIRLSNELEAIIG